MPHGLLSDLPNQVVSCLGTFALAAANVSFHLQLFLISPISAKISPQKAVTGSLSVTFYPVITLF